MVIAAIWDGMRRIGLKPGAQILEPSMGVGHFFGMMPEELLPGSHRTGVELDHVSARIARELYPDSTIFARPFEETPLPDKYFDVVVGNVPFGDYGVHDPSMKPQLTRAIHDYFFAKSLEKARPGGVMALITSRFIADVLRHYPDLPIRLEQGGRIRVENHSDRQLHERELHRFARYNPLCTDSACTLEYSPDNGIALAILTRVPNPHAPGVPVTILNADFGRAVEQMARVLTEEDRIRKARELIKFEIPLPDAFQVLCAVPIRSMETEYRPVSLQLITARPYSARGV
jgi:hypothetical protein